MTTAPATDDTRRRRKLLATPAGGLTQGTSVTDLILSVVGSRARIDPNPNHYQTGRQRSGGVPGLRR